ncbi:hypothetical protein Tco_1404036 [Tanacetum coccineum]
MENAQAESNPTKPITDNNINIELSKEFLIELKNNAYHGMFDEDVVDHIAKVLGLLYLIKIPGVDSHRLRMKVFPLLLADDARQWWINEEERKINTWEELVEEFFLDGRTKKVLFHSWMNGNWNKRRMNDNILNNNEWYKSDYGNPLNTATDSFFKAHDERDIEEGSELRQMKR